MLMLLCCCADSKEDEITIVSKKKAFAEKDADGDGLSMLHEREIEVIPSTDLQRAGTDGFREEESTIASQGEVHEGKAAPLCGEFMVNISKIGKIGFSVEALLDDYCIVRSVDPGSSLDAKPYDRLLRVNGQCATARKMAKMISDNDSLELVFQRPNKKDIMLPKKGKKAGFNIDCQLASVGLVIKSLADGGAAKSLEEGTFKPYDRIIAVDGQEGPPLDLMKMLIKSDSPLLTVCSYS
ncbi:unnamed protein product [Durusdinium trenchii]|uniref:PDZ domain-containing protein n=1 Tax=Durusdinium trenchii TaxID=1381693 RepID=A0ABP0I0H8_9DINO